MIWWERVKCFFRPHHVWGPSEYAGGIRRWVCKRCGAEDYE